MYLAVKEETGHARVYATKNKTDASPFYILLTDDGDHPYEFYIGWQKEAAQEGEVDGTMRYLMAKVSILGRSDGPLCLESRAQKRVSLFSLNNRLTSPFYRHEPTVNPKVWFKGQESFLIRCARRRGCVDGFVAIEQRNDSQGTRRTQRNARQGTPRTQGNVPQETLSYQTVCRRNPGGHDNGQFHMTFQLHPKDDIPAQSQSVSIPQMVLETPRL